MKDSPIKPPAAMQDASPEVLQSLERAERGTSLNAWKYQLAYHLLTHELLKLVQDASPEGDVSNLDIVKALTKAAGELT